MLVFLYGEADAGSSNLSCVKYLMSSTFISSLGVHAVPVKCFFYMYG